MKHVQVQGERVPAIGLGTWQLSGNDCVEAVADAIAAGYRHIDTAQMYHNEAEVGEGIRRADAPREQLFVTTKLDLDNLSAQRVEASTAQSLRKLQLDYVDLLLIHWPSRQTPLSETLGAMNRLRERGAVRHVGVSNFTPRLVEQAAELTQVFANQIEYHPMLAQHALLEQARRMDYLITAYRPLGRGRVLDEPAITAIAEAHGKTPAQVVLRWLVQQENVSAIPKAASPAHRRDNLDIFDFELSDAEMRRIASLDRQDRMVNPDWAPDWG